MLLFLTVFFVIVNRSIASIEYTNEIIDEFFTIYENPYISLEINLESNDVYLTIKKPITNADLRLDIMAIRFDGVEFRISNDPTPLCNVLETEATNQADNIFCKLQITKIFSINGMHCPIPAMTRKLKPYVFPSHITLENDIGCGQFTYRITINLCDEENLPDCVSILSANVVVDSQAKHCSNNLM